MFASLLANAEAASSDVTVFCDGARTSAELEGVRAVQAFVRDVQGFRSLRIKARNTNLGLADSIISGVSEMLLEYDRVVVLEDDLLLSPYFLKYINEGLSMYDDDPRVASIHGYTYPIGEELPATFFMRGADCWGWGTWKRSWSCFEADGRVLLERLATAGEQIDFDLGGAYPYTRMLADQTKGLNNSWAVRWHASAFVNGMLTLYPGRSLVCNIGHDSSGTHCGKTDAFAVEPTREPITVERIALEPSALARVAFERYLRKLSAPSSRWSVSRAIRLLRGLLP